MKRKWTAGLLALAALGGLLLLSGCAGSSRRAESDLISGASGRPATAAPASPAAIGMRFVSAMRTPPLTPSPSKRRRAARQARLRSSASRPGTSSVSSMPLEIFESVSVSCSPMDCMTIATSW